MSPIVIMLLFGLPFVFLAVWAFWVLVQLPDWGALRRWLHRPQGAAKPKAHP
jgi:hypothetical protein